MFKLSDIGRVFYGTSIAGLGFLTVYYKGFPYFLIPSEHLSIPGLVFILYISGGLLMLAGTSIVFGKESRLPSLLLGGALLMIFCFYFIPYQFIVSKNYLHFGDWENSAKELTLASGAFVIAGCFSGSNENAISRFLGKWIPFGAILFSVAIISFGVDHFLYGKEAADYVPSWIPNHLFWIYFCGIPLTGSGMAIILKIWVKQIAALLGSMIFIWVIILHIPYVVAAPSAPERSGEAASAFIALASSGIAFVIAGRATRKKAFSGNSV